MAEYKVIRYDPIGGSVEETIEAEHVAFHRNGDIIFCNEGAPEEPHYCRLTVAFAAGHWDKIRKIVGEEDG